MKNEITPAPQPAPTPEELAAIEEQDILMGQQLTEQYHKAVGGMTEVLRFGAMMMMLTENVSARGHVKFGGKGRGVKDGVSEWLRTRAPDVKKPTAYRFLNVALAVAEKFATPKKIGFAELATTPADKLPAPLQKKQAELWNFVSGTSQRSWLDQFTPKGGKTERPNGTNRRTKAEKEVDDAATISKRWHDLVFPQFRFAFLRPKESWLHCDDLALANLADVVKRFSKELDEVCKSRKIVPSKVADWSDNLPAELQTVAEEGEE